MGSILTKEEKDYVVHRVTIDKINWTDALNEVYKIKLQKLDEQIVRYAKR